MHATFTEIIPGAYPVETNVLKAAIFVPVRLSHAGIAETAKKISTFSTYRPITLFPLLLLNNIASGGLSATAELLVKIFPF